MQTAWDSVSADGSRRSTPHSSGESGHGCIGSAPSRSTWASPRRSSASELHAGKSLAQIATAHGKTVEGLVDAIVTPAKAHLDKAVANGHLTRQRADEILGRLDDAVEKAVQRVRAAGR